MTTLEHPETADFASEKQAIEELFLLELRYRQAKQLDIGSHRPIFLNQPEKAWLVYSGEVNVFAVRIEGGRVVGARTFLFHAEGGDMLFGMQAGPDGTCLMAVGGVGTRLLELERQQLGDFFADEKYLAQMSAMTNNWIIGLTSGIFQQLPPKECSTLGSSESQLLLSDKGKVRPHRAVQWVAVQSGEVWVAGQPHLSLAAESSYFPLPRRLWLESVGKSHLSFLGTADYIRQQFSWSDLDACHHLLLESIHHQAATEEEAERQRVEQKAEIHRTSIENAFSQLASILQSDAPDLSLSEIDGGALLKAFQLIGNKLQIDIAPPVASGAQEKQEDQVSRMARASKIRIRRVALKGEWWQQDNGPMLAFVEEGGQPVALLPASAARYTLHDPATGSVQPVTTAVAETLRPFAYTLYRSFPVAPQSAWNLFRFGLQGRARELWMVLLMASGVSLLGLLTPITTGILFDAIIPGSIRSQLVEVSLVLLASAVAGALFLVTQSIAMLRLEGKIDAVLQAAVWDRLLNLPIPFFRAFSAGDLGLRAMGISTIRRTLSGVTIASIISGVFSVFNFGLLFYYDSALAWVASALVFVAFLASSSIGYVQVKHQRQLSHIEGQLSGMVLQFITGITKLRVAGAESRVFAFWAKDFSRKKKQAFKARNAANWLNVFKSTYPLLTSLGLFAMIAYSNEVSLTTGQFIAFHAAFTQLLLSGLQLSFTLVSALSVVPTYERLKPILESLPEIDEARADPGVLQGGIEISHASFRYREDGPLILKDVSIEAKPGEFIALVGPSGSGKSTIFRLMLGFEQLETGAVYYAGQDLAHLDIQAVRRQLGVVLQNGRVMAGTIFSNIVGSSLLTINDAWDAAKMVAFDEDVNAMPMGMHTVVTEGGGTLSGGQRQRLLIARAVVRKPRILLFDEATSALDNKTQAVVSESLENLQATRIVIAHRLSTIMNADRIYVLQHGRVVQAGTYAELLNQAGVFAELARRQMA